MDVRWKMEETRQGVYYRNSRFAVIVVVSIFTLVSVCFWGNE